MLPVLVSSPRAVLLSYFNVTTSIVLPFQQSRCVMLFRIEVAGRVDIEER